VPESQLTYEQPAENAVSDEKLQTAEIARRAEDVVKSLHAVSRSAAIYPLGHALVTKATEDALGTIYHALNVTPSVALVMTEKDVLCENLPLHGARGVADEFIADWHTRNVSSITFTQGITLEELNTLVRISATPVEEDTTDLVPVDEQLAEDGVEHIRVTSFIDEVGERADDKRQRMRARAVYTSALDVARAALDSARIGQDVDVEKVRAVVSDMVDSLVTNEAALIALANIREHDEYMFAHAVNVSVLALALGCAMDIHDAQLVDFGIGVMLHDVGKTQIPDEVLHKPTALTEGERALLRRHPVEGARMLARMAGAPKVGLVVAYEHHIRHDGSGYPKLIQRRSPSMLSQVVGTADYYDIATTLRPGTKPLLPDEAIAEMLRSRGTSFHPNILDKFVQMMGVFPPGTFVKLDTNEFAVVLSNNSDSPERPRVRVVVDAEGNRLAEPADVDLRETDKGTGEHVRSVVHSMDPILKEFDVGSVL
jgi:HD-GYP domain-containing protein (c-di-GMP phosphodiesterase class II)